tara:strand:+ start:5563 stop:6582 length:1020 start_codon:yes stop_codon:yes gene_type:complete
MLSCYLIANLIKCFAYNPLRSKKSMNFNDSIFVCSKPLQFFNAASIARGYGIENAKMIVVDRAISDAESFSDFVLSNYLGDLFDEVIFVSSYDEAVKEVNAAKCRNLFVEDDRVSLYYLFQKADHENLLVYEEGIGTYLGHYKYMLSWPKYFRWYLSSKLFGCGLDFGESRSTKFVFVRYPKILIWFKPKLAGKVKPIAGHISEINLLKDQLFEFCSDNFQSLFDEGKAEEDVALILGTWGGLKYEDYESICGKSYSEILYKPHPHDGAGIKKIADIRELAWLPAEALVLFLAEAYRKVVVYHYGSSVEFYKRDLPKNVEFYCLSSPGLRYQRIMKAAY